MWPNGMLDPFFSNPKRIALWTHQANWPRNPVGYNFLPRQVHSLGQKLYSTSWEGTEPAVAHHQPLPALNTAALGREVHQRAVNLLRAHVQSYKERADAVRWSSLCADAFSPSDPMPTEDEWKLVVPISRTESERTSAALERYYTVCGYLRFAFESSHIRTFSRDLDGGQMRHIEPHFWNSDELQHRFDTARINYNKPFDREQAAFTREWIFGVLEEFERFWALTRPLVGPDASSNRSTNSSMTKSEADNCLVWLEGQMRADPEVRPHSKRHYRGIAKSDFNVGPRKFEHIWATAIAQSRATSWSKAGAPRGPRKSAQPKSMHEEKS